LWQGFTV
jgi:hypothetical protein